MARIGQQVMAFPFWVPHLWWLIASAHVTCAATGSLSDALYDGWWGGESIGRIPGDWLIGFLSTGRGHPRYGHFPEEWLSEHAAGFLDGGWRPGWLPQEKRDDRLGPADRGVGLHHLSNLRHSLGRRVLR